jgi:hypothetical protein
MIMTVAAKKYDFMLGTDGWTTVGHGTLEHRSWIIAGQRVDIGLEKGPSLSHFIIGKEARVNVDARNRNDKDLWYFQSPPITLGFRPTLLTFNMMSFSGDFRRLNRSPALVRLRFEDGSLAEFPVYQEYDGSLKTFYVPFVEKLWTIIYDAPTIIYDVPTISYDAPTISYDAPTISYNDRKSSIAGGCSIAGTIWYNKPFRLEILGDWTQGWETIGLDNVEIV